jgi:cytoskeletal protein CcmA (bactofilin family)/DNA-directed RNA polymerase subunit RPC12/RpoP
MPEATQKLILSMAPSKKDTVAVACPKCGHVQPEPRTAYSSICKKCHEHFRLQEALRPVSRPVKQTIEHRQVRCFQCGTELEVPTAAASTMCKRCSSHVDLADYQITQTFSKSFRTHGRLVLEEKGYLLNTESLVGEAVLKGRLIGKLTTEGALEIHSSATIKGELLPGRLVIPLGHHFRWPRPLTIRDAEISGELVADLNGTGTVVFKPTARFFGNVVARNLVMGAGAVFVGEARIGKPR